MRALKFLIVILAVPAAAMAQDTRKVTEPAIPPTCAVVNAHLASHLSASGGTLDEASDTTPDTSRIQAAIDGCAAGHSVALRADRGLGAFLSGPLQLRTRVTLEVDAGAILFASKNPRDYDLKPGVCGTIDQSGHGCRALINGDHAEDSGVMGDGIIDGRGGEKILGQDITWWELADKARAGGNQNNPRILILSHCDNFTLYKITLRNSPNFHVDYKSGNGFTVWGVKIYSPKRARNTDGIDPGNSTNVTITHSFIDTGDDNVAIKAGAGLPTTHMTISQNHFYSGHGMSIGSETNGGASAIRVKDLSMDGGDNAIRIKSNWSRGGLVHDVVYDDVCIRDVTNPILMDTHYSPVGKDAGMIPVFEDITLRNVRIYGGGKVTLDGYSWENRLKMTFDNVWSDVAGGVRVMASHALLTKGPGPVNLPLSGEDVKVEGYSVKGVPNSCVNKFVPFPGR
jgi:polygalacturonase